jgi:ABC-type transport system involved in multi-copper enzyme maturation permease subunit
MWIGPILRRELIVLVRRKAVYFDRFTSLAMVTAVILGCVWAWDRWKWDLVSLAGASAFARTSFGLVIAVQVNLVIALVLRQVAMAIAAERDRKSLDALLATRLSSAEVVLGTMAAGLVRWANGLAAVVPVFALMTVFGGVDPRLMLLAVAGLASTAFAFAAIAVIASISARTSRQAIVLAFSITSWWLGFPALFVILKPRLWPAGPRWLVSLAVGLLSSSPMGVVANLSGLVRMGSPVQAVWRMIGWETFGGIVLVLWAIWRLRPASRAHYDDETRIAGLRILRAAKWRRPRPPCGDNPVLWNAIYSHRTVSPPARVLGQLINICLLGTIAVITFWFAVPAFQELAVRGYGAAPEAFAMPEGNPFARMLINKLVVPTGGPASGQARLEFNLALRQFSAFFAVFFAFAILVAAAESVMWERERDTWTGLLVTPLTGWEIIRAKILGVLFRLRGSIMILVGLWTVGLSAGAVHPLGLLASFVGIAATGGCYAALGVYVSLLARDRSAALNLNALLPFLLATCGLVIQVPGRGSVLLAAASPPFLAFTSLFSYEDVHTLIHAGVIPMYAGPTSFQPGLGARSVLAAWLLGTVAHAVGALYLTRAMCLTFDEVVGRPTPARPSNRATHEARVKVIAVSENGSA